MNSSSARPDQLARQRGCAPPRRSTSAARSSAGSRTARPGRSARPRGRGAAARARSSRRCRSARSPSAATSMPAAARVGEARPSAAATRAALASRRVREAEHGARVSRQRRRATGPARQRQAERRRQRLGAAQQRAADQPVLDDVAERLVADLAVVVVHGERRVALADPDVVDRLGVAARAPATGRAPRAGGASLARSRSRGRRRPAPRVATSGWRSISSTRSACARDGAGERQPGHAAADDRQVEGIARTPMAASVAARPRNARAAWGRSEPR